MSIGTFQGKQLSWKKILFKVYGFWVILFWDLARSFNRVAKAAQFFLQKAAEEKHLFWKKRLSSKSFRTVSKDFLTACYFFLRFQRKIFTKKTCSQKKTFMALSDICGGFFRITDRIFWHDSQNCISGFQRNVVYEKKCCQENWICFNYGFWANFCLKFSAIFSASQSNLHSTWPRKYYEETIFCFS